MEFLVQFASGKSFEDLIGIKVKASSKQEALEIALQENPDLINWNYFIN